MSRPLEGILAIPLQFAFPGRAARALESPPSSWVAMAASAVVILVAGAMPILMFPDPSGEAGGRAMIAYPLLHLAERCMVGAAAGLAAWGASKLSGADSHLPVQLRAAFLSQAAYSILMPAAVTASVAMGSAVLPGVLHLAVLAAGPSSIPLPAAVLLSFFDVPSIVCLVLWGLLVAALERRSRAAGILTAFSMYLLAALGLSLPSFSAPAQ